MSNCTVPKPASTRVPVPVLLKGSSRVNRQISTRVILIKNQLAVDPDNGANKSHVGRANPADATAT